MELWLFHKDHEVCLLDLDDNYELLSIKQVFDKKRMPVGTNVSEYDCVSDETDFHKFKIWWKTRFIPSDRKYLKKVLDLLNLKSVDALVAKTHCASLNDHYWTKSAQDDSSWGKINFFENPFDDSVGLLLLFNRERNFSEKSFNNPDFTTDGALPKRWTVENGKRFLIKGTDSAFQQEPFNEYITHILCSKLGINSVPYQILQSTNGDGEIEYLSSCENFVTVNTEFVSAYFIKESIKKTNNESDYQHFLRGCNLLGAKNVESDLNKMLFVDFIMANTDRHYRNFGLLRDSDTLEEQFNLLEKGFLLSLVFDRTGDVGQIFSTILKSNVYITDKRRNALCECLDARISQAISLVRENRRIRITKSRVQREFDRLDTLNSLVLI